MRCIIYVFSGTGNTMLVAEEYAASLGPETHIAAIDSSFMDLPSPDGYQLVGIGYPVHAFNAPEIVERFARELKPSVHQDLFIFHTGGEGLHFNDTSSVRIRRILRKDFTILSERHYVMPYNMVYRHSDAMAAKMLATAKARIPKDAQSVLLGTVAPLEYPLRARIMTVLCKIERPGMRLNGRLYKVNKDKNNFSIHIIH